MGMFDCVECAYPLPDGAPRNGYQSKDTPSQSLCHYLITADGLLLDDTGGAIDFHGDIEFYQSNIVASGPQGYVTSDGRNATFWTFKARFTNGRVEWIRPVQEEMGELFRRGPLTTEEWRSRGWGDRSRP
jgi:hypothetical protein